jgi:hypothetical protein
MYPFRYSTIFRSRWMALLWAAGILWTAYDYAAPDSNAAAGNNQQAASDDGGSLSNADVAALKDSLNQIGG